MNPESLEIPKTIRNSDLIIVLVKNVKIFYFLVFMEKLKKSNILNQIKQYLYLNKARNKVKLLIKISV